MIRILCAVGLFLVFSLTARAQDGYEATSIVSDLNVVAVSLSGEELSRNDVAVVVGAACSAMRTARVGQLPDQLFEAVSRDSCRLSWRGLPSPWPAPLSGAKIRHNLIGRHRSILSRAKAWVASAGRVLVHSARCAEARPWPAASRWRALVLGSDFGSYRFKTADATNFRILSLGFIQFNCILHVEPKLRLITKELAEA